MVFGLVRAADSGTAQRRLVDAVLAAGQAYEVPQAAALAARVRAIRGDLESTGLGICESEMRVLQSARCLQIWHCAASLKNTEADLEEIRANNMDGTERMLELTVALRPEAFNHMSTAYVTGRYTGTAPEARIERGRSFENRYEWSKYHGEELVVETCERAGIPWRILRPSIVIGHSRTRLATAHTGFLGCVIKMAALARTARDILRGQPLRLVGRPDGELNLIPIDSVVEDCLGIDDSGSGTFNRVFHLTNTAAPSFGAVCAAFCDSVGIARFELVASEQDLDPLSRRLHRITQFERPYLGAQKTFSRDESRTLYASPRHGQWAMPHDELCRIVHAVVDVSRSSRKAA